MEHHSFINTLILTAVNFALYFLLLMKFVFPKLKESLERKEKKVLEELERSRAELSKAKETYKRALEEKKKAEEEKGKIKKEIIELAKAEAEKIREEANRFAKSKLDEVEKTLKMRGEEMKKELEMYALQLAVNLAKEKIKQGKTKEDEERLFSSLIDKIEQMKN